MEEWPSEDAPAVAGQNSGVPKPTHTPPPQDGKAAQSFSGQLRKPFWLLNNGKGQAKTGYACADWWQWDV